MKVITDYFSPPPSKKTKNRPGKSKQKIDCIVSNESDAEDVTYDTRKIRIRLKDPKDPKSYFCEIYDTSPEEMDKSTLQVVMPKKKSIGRRRCSRRLVDLKDSDASSEDDTFETRNSRTKGSTRNNSENGSHLIRNYFPSTASSTTDTERKYATRSASKSPMKTSNLVSQEAYELGNIHLNNDINKDNSDNLLEGRRKSTRIVKKVLRDSTLENLEISKLSKVKRSSSVASPLKDQSSKRVKCEKLEADKIKDADDMEVDEVTEDNHILNIKNNNLKSEKSDLPLSNDNVVAIVSHKFNRDLRKQIGLEKITDKKNSNKSQKKIQSEEQILPQKVKDKNSKRIKSEEKSDVQKGILNYFPPKLDRSCEVVLVRTPTLASVFNHQKKHKIDPEILKARQDFLRNGIEIVKPKPPDKLHLKYSYFPDISHVQQRCDNSLWNVRPMALRLKKSDDFSKTNSLIFKSPVVTDKSTTKPNMKRYNKYSSTPDNVLSNLEKCYKNISIQCLYEKYKKRYNQWLENSSGDTTPVWTEKYKLEADDILDNKNTIQKLRSWLKAWQDFDMQRGNKRERRISNESSDCFVNSSDDEMQPSHVPITACMLIGPCASGKTAAVYALAEELEFNVLEVNSSVKRSGKRMLADLQEATQSRNLSQDRAELTDCKNSMSIILVEEANVVFDEHDEGFTNGVLQLVTSSKRPVIFLTDDPDVKHLQKVRQSITNLLQLKTIRPTTNSACAILEVIALVEGIHTPRSNLIQLLHNNSNDLRKSLIELQFWMENNDCWTMPTLAKLTANTFWWGSHAVLFNKKLWQPLLPTLQTKNKQRHADLFDVSECSDNDEHTDISSPPIQLEEPQPKFVNLPKILKFLESASFVELLHGLSSSVDSVQWGTLLVKDSLSLMEDLTYCYCQSDSISQDISNTIYNCSTSLFESGKHAEDVAKYPTQQQIRWKNKRKNAEKELMKALPLGICSGDKLYTDYLPGLRNLCRSECARKNRQSIEGKRLRTSRNQHYLNNFGTTITDFNSSVNCLVFKT